MSTACFRKNFNDHVVCDWIFFPISYPHYGLHLLTENDGIFPVYMYVNPSCIIVSWIQVSWIIVWVTLALGLGGSFFF